MTKLKVFAICAFVTLATVGSFSAYSATMICDMTKCKRIMGGWVCEKNACKLQ